MAEPGEQSAAPEPGEARFRVVAGHPSDEEAAAVAAVLAVLARRRQARAATPSAAPRSGWADRRRTLLPAPAPGPGGWRRSALPR